MQDGASRGRYIVFTVHRICSAILWPRVSGLVFGAEGSELRRIIRSAAEYVELLWSTTSLMSILPVADPSPSLASDAFSQLIQLTYHLAKSLIFFIFLF